MGSEMCIRDRYNATRIVIPTKARRYIANLLHAAHSGITKMMKTATQLYYWPGMRTHFENIINNCEECQSSRPTQARPKITSSPPSHAQLPMNELGSDIYDALGKSWLVLADRYSGYVWNACIKDKCTETVVKQLRSWFIEFGWPNSLRTDGGPAYRNEFTRFCTANGCLLYTSPSPRDLSTSRMPSSA